MTKEELREHCEKQVKMCEEWAKANDREPSGKIYEEHKLILELLDQQPSDDCISRTQAIEWIENLRQIDKCFGNYEDDYFPLSEVIDRLKNVPPVTPTIPKGATNGNIMTAMFPDINIHEHEKTDICDAYIQIDIWDFSIYVSEDWWNALYKRGSEE